MKELKRYRELYAVKCPLCGIKTYNVYRQKDKTTYKHGGGVGRIGGPFTRLNKALYCEVKHK